MRKIKVLFVCMGNICRSPTAHGVFEGMVKSEGLGDRIEVDSAGTHAYHVGNPPDNRAQQTALGRGFDLSSQRARQASSEDFLLFDYILAMDKDNYANLAAISPGGEMRAELKLFMDFTSGFFKAREVPDPYYGGDQGFEKVFDMVEEASRGLLSDIREKHL
ncbi:MAG: low molecular weight protein-tyrosine-phosphatase [Sedimenticola sp.]